MVERCVREHKPGGVRCRAICRTFPLVLRFHGISSCLKSRSKIPLTTCLTTSVEIFIFRGVAQLGRALRSGRRGRGFESRRLDQKPHYKAIYWLCNAVFLFGNVLLLHLQSNRNGVFEGRPVLGRVFLCCSILCLLQRFFEKKLVVGQFIPPLFFVGYISVSLSMRYIVKHETPNNSGLNRSRV